MESKTEYDFQIISDDHNSYITYMLEEYIHHCQPNLSLAIKILDNDFTGWNIGVWFLLDDLYEFIDDLNRLEKTRKGTARLQAMTPKDFSIQFESYHAKGDIAVYYEISQSKITSNISIENTLSGGFELDSEFICALVKDFKKLASVSDLKESIDFI